MIKAVKLADIAEKLNVSVVTVSKALSGQKGVSEEMREKIKLLADELGYKPVRSQIAGDRGKNKSYTIGVISPERYFAKFASFYWKMYQELTTKAIRQNCFTMLEVITNYAEDHLEPPKLFEEEHVDGIVVIGKPTDKYLQVLKEQCRVPMIFMDFYDHTGNYDAIVSEGYYGTYLLTNYLFSQGHTRIAYVGTLLYSDSITDRYMGYCRSLIEHGVEVRKDWIIEDRNIQTGKMNDGQYFILPEEMPTAFVCNCDLSAYYMREHLKESGIRVPEDVSIVGFDDYLYPAHGENDITTYVVDMGAMSEMVIERLTGKIEGNAEQGNIHVVPGKIVYRNTVARK